MMADQNQVKVTYIAEIADLKKKLAEIPGQTASQARASVRELDRAAKAIQKAQDQAVKNASKTGQASARLVQTNIAQAKEGVASLGAALSVVSPEAGAVVTQIGALGGAAKAAAAAASGMGVSLGVVAAAAAPVVVVLGALFLAYQDVTREQELASQLAETQRAATASLTPMVRDLEDATLDLAVATGQYTAEQGRQIEASIRAQRAVLDLAASQAEQRKQLQATIESNNAWKSALESVQSVAEWTPAGAVLGWIGYNDALTSGIDSLMGWSEENESARAQLSVLSSTVVEAGAKQKELRGITEQLTASKRANAAATREQTAAELAANAVYEAQKQERADLREQEELYRDWQKTSRQEAAEADAKAEAEAAAAAAAAIEKAKATAAAQRDAIISTTATSLEALASVADFVVGRLEGTGPAAEAAFNAWKALSYAAAVAQGAQAAVSAYAAMAAIPVIGPTILAPAAAAAAVVTTGVQIAKIASTEMPTYHSGGIVDTAPDEMVAKVTRGEGVLTRVGVDTMGGPEAVRRANQGQAAPSRIEIPMVYKHRIFARFFADYQKSNPSKPAVRPGRRF